MVKRCQVATTLPSSVSHPLHALTEPAFTVQDLEELHQPVSPRLYTISGLAPTLQAVRVQQSAHSFTVTICV